MNDPKPTNDNDPEPTWWSDWLLIAAVAIGMPAITYIVFEKWFLVPLPKGPLEEWLGL